MNHGTLDMLTAVQLTEVRNDIGYLLGDTSIGAVGCSYRARGAHAYDPRTGIAASTETVSGIIAVITPLTEREIASSDGARRGDVHILFAASQLTTAPRVDDTVVVTDTGVRYHVLDVESYGMATHYNLTGRTA